MDHFPFCYAAECTVHCGCACHEPLYKVVIAEGAADMLLTDDYNPNTEILKYSRNSPIVMYCRLSDSDALELATQANYEVTRTKEDWSI